MFTISCAFAAYAITLCVTKMRALRRVHPRIAGLIELVVIVGVALALAEGVQAEVVKPFKIPSGSMEPTLKIGQRVLVDRLAFDFGSPRRGEVVVFHPPAGLNCASSTYFVKRIMGLPGDRLSIRDGHPVINGRELTNEPYIARCGLEAECNMPVTITIPPGHYFMMGDNRGNSDDSRFWGPIPESWMVGNVFFTYWPPDRVG